MTIFRRPNSSASTEIQPGPSRTSAVAISAAEMFIQEASIMSAESTENLLMATAAALKSTSMAAIGVRNPINSSTPLASSTVPASGECDRMQLIPRIIAETPIANLSKNNPNPGAPQGNVEKKGRRLCPHRIAYKFDRDRESLKGMIFYQHYRVGLQFDDAAADRNGYCFRAITGAELLHNVTDMALHGIF
jgi:hypothetical protein